MMNAAEWRYVPFSEERLVTRLIKSRSKLECLKGNDDILCVLIDLDRQIATTELEAEQRYLLQMIMLGNSLGDLADMLSLEYASVELQFRDAVKRIVRQNNLEWVRMYGSDKPLSANCRED